MPTGCRIAVIANDALGNYVVLTPLLQMLRSKYAPSALDLFTGHRTQELWSRDPLVSDGFLAMDTTKGDARARSESEYDLIINIEASRWAKLLCASLASGAAYVVGPCFCNDSLQELPAAPDNRGALSVDPDWTSPNLVANYPFLDSPFIGEILCRLAYLDGPIPSYSVPKEETEGQIPDVLIAVSASLEDKLWPSEKWIETLSWMRELRLDIGLIGASPIEQQKYWVGNVTEGEILLDGLASDLRGKFRLPEVVGALQRARLVLSIDNGIMHLGAAVNAPVIGLFRENFHRLWAPPVQSVQVISPGIDHRVADIDVARVKEAIYLAMGT